MQINLNHSSRYPLISPASHEDMAKIDFLPGEIDMISVLQSSCLIMDDLPHPVR